MCNSKLYIKLTNKQKHAIRDWFKKGIEKGYIAGPFDPDYDFPWPLHISPLFVVPKPLKDEYRPIAHLSHTKYPTDYSVNDILNEADKHVKYVQFQEIVEMMLNAGRNAYMWTIDAQDAYYRIPIHRSEYKYMGLEWENNKYVFLSLQMGLASAPRIYTRFGDAVQYIIVKNNRKDAYINGTLSIRHYLDDYFGVGRTKQQSDRMFYATFNWFQRLNIPTQARKCSESSQSQKLLGWIWDSKHLRCELPKNKRIKALNRLNALLRDGNCTKKQLERLVGILQHISLVIFPGKTFVRRLEILIYKSFTNYKQKITIDDWIRDDIRWWIWVLDEPRHVRAQYAFLLKKPSAVTKHIYTDAASTIGAGGIMDDLTYRIKWSDTKLADLIRVRGTFDIHAQEMLGALIAVKLWGDRLAGQCVALYNDNPGAAGAIATKAPPLYRLDMQYMVRELAKLAIKYHFYFWSIKIDGDQNDQADALSRFKPLHQFNLQQPLCKMESFEKTQQITNEYMNGLLNYRVNVDPYKKQWNMYAIQQMQSERNLKSSHELNSAHKWKVVQLQDDYH